MGTKKSDHSLTEGGSEPPDSRASQMLFLPLLGSKGTDLAVRKCQGANTPSMLPSCCSLSL